jgi:hypothetical protein
MIPQMLKWCDFRWTRFSQVLQELKLFSAISRVPWVGKRINWWTVDRLCTALELKQRNSLFKVLSGTTQLKRRSVAIATLRCYLLRTSLDVIKRAIKIFTRLLEKLNDEVKYFSVLTGLGNYYFGSIYCLSCSFSVLVDFWAVHLLMKLSSMTFISFLHLFFFFICLHDFTSLHQLFSYC